MSVENGKVCCNCRHNIRHYDDKGGACYCEIDNHYIGYIECMEGWCRHWAKERQTVRNGMADIELVIKIPKYVYNTIVANDGYIADCDNEKVGMAIINGTTLSKKHGEWVSEIVDREDWKGIKRRCYQPTSCSVCHKPCAIEYPYCPRCGAKMVVESEGKE